MSGLDRDSIREPTQLHTQEAVSLKVTRTQDSLVIRDTGRVLAMLLLSAGLVSAFMAAAGGFGQRETIGAALGALVCLVGAVLTSEQRVVRFDARRGLVEWRRERWLRAPEEKTLNFGEVRDVAIEPAPGMDPTAYRAALITADGQRLPLSGYREDKRAVTDLTATVLEFLNREKSREDVIQTSIRELVAQNRTIDAVKLAAEEYGLDAGAARDHVLRASKRQ